MLLERFKKEAKKLGIIPGDSILTALSGGIDSVVMLHLLLRMGMNPVVAHCNFRLRGNESDEDEAFCKMLAKKNGLLCFTKKFNTVKESQKRGLTIQETARVLRYQWFHELKVRYYQDHIAVAHNANDVTETFFINLLRGSGLKGLCSIPEKNGAIVRPLLFASREEIENYARQHGLEYRQDSSNDSDKYLRNKIRHRLIPLLEELRPGASEKVFRTAEILSTYRIFVNDHLENTENPVLTYKNEQLLIKRAALKNHAYPGLILQHCLSPLGFTSDAIHRLASSKEMQTGKCFISNGFVLTIGRSYMVVEARKQEDISEIFIRSEGDYVWNGFRFIVTRVECTKPSGGKDFVLIDDSLADLPLIVRSRRTGDRMHPFGMKGTRKISDLLTDAKVAAHLKAKWPVIQQKDKIIWLPGVRSSQHIAVEKWSGSAWKIECIQP